jgi:uncharacterized DUF497 family protein
MIELRFVWDPVKARTNVKDHHITFEEAQTVFYDEHGVEFFDDRHSDWEERFLMLGLSARRRLLLVCYCYRESESVIRIISARKATPREAQFYRR